MWGISLLHSFGQKLDNLSINTGIKLNSPTVELMRPVLVIVTDIYVAINKEALQISKEEARIRYIQKMLLRYKIVI